MIVNTVWNGKRYFLSKCPSGFNVEMDATENYGGDGKGLTPMELILVGVAGCIGIDVTMLLGKNLEKIKKMEIKKQKALGVMRCRLHLEKSKQLLLLKEILANNDYVKPSD